MLFRKRQISLFDELTTQSRKHSKKYPVIIMRNANSSALSINIEADLTQLGINKQDIKNTMLLLHYLIAVDSRVFSGPITILVDVSEELDAPNLGFYGSISEDIEMPGYSLNPLGISVYLLETIRSEIYSTEALLDHARAEECIVTDVNPARSFDSVLLQMVIHESRHRYQCTKECTLFNRDHINSQSGLNIPILRYVHALHESLREVKHLMDPQEFAELETWYSDPDEFDAKVIESLFVLRSLLEPDALNLKDIADIIRSQPRI